MNLNLFHWGCRWSEFGMSSMSPLTSLALFQQSRLNIVGNVVLAHFGPLITDGHSVNASVFLVLLLTVWPVYHLQTRIMHQAIKQKSNWFHEHGSKLTRSEVSGTSWGCGWSGKSQHEYAADKSADIMWCNHVNMEQSLTQKWNAVSKRSAI